MEAGLLGDTDTPRGKPLADRLEGQPGLAAALAEIDAGCAAAGVSKQLTTMRWFFNHSALRPGDAIIMGASTLDQLEANLDQLCATHTPSGALSKNSLMRLVWAAATRSTALCRARSWR